MAIQVQIDGNDKTKFVFWKSLRIENILTTQVDKCTFIINQNYRDQEYIPQVGNEIIITDNGTRVFAGYIVRRDQMSREYKKITYKIECTDYTRLLQKRLVAETYENMTVEDIIKAIIDTYIPTLGIDYTNVNCTKLTTKVTFNYESIQQCIERLSNIVGYDWWVDYNKNLYFKGVGTVIAPFALSDTSGSYIFNSLRIRKDNSQIKNSIIVRGGNYFGDKRRELIEANGEDFIFPVGYKYRDFSASLTGQPLDIGIDFSSDPDAYDALHNYNEKRLVFKEADKPSIGATLSVSGDPYIPVIVKVKDPAAIESMLSAEGVAGDYEEIIVDKNLTSKEEARDRANAELIAYKQTLEEGEFITETSGLEAGQQISIISDAYDIDETFLVKQVTRKMLTPEVMRYHIRLISTRTIDMIGLLQQLLMGQVRQIEVDADEVLDLVNSFYETITLEEADVVVSKVHNPQLETLTAEDDVDQKPLDYPIKFVAAPFIPTGFDVLLTGLTGRWKIDEGSGTTINDSVGTNHGTMSGASWEEKGIDGYCLDFTNITDKIDLGSSYTLSGAFSIAFWGAPENLNDTRGVCGNQTDYNDGRLSFFSDLGGVSRFYVWTDNTNGWFNLTIDIPEDEFAAYVLTRDGSYNWILYRNGINITSGTPNFDGSIIMNRIGDNPDNSGWEAFSGRLCDFRLYNGTVLSAADAMTYYNSIKRVFNCNGSRLG